MNIYQGKEIFRCEQLGVGQCDGKGWHVQTFHDLTGVPWSEKECPKFPTFAAAKAIINTWMEDSEGDEHV